jgi:hypothetical protein
VLAHSFFETEGRRDGHDIEHWLRAEDQLSNGRLSQNKARQRVLKARWPVAARTLRVLPPVLLEAEGKDPYWDFLWFAV